MPGTVNKSSIALLVNKYHNPHCLFDLLTLEVILSCPISGALGTVGI